MNVVRLHKIYVISSTNSQTSCQSKWKQQQLTKLKYSVIAVNRYIPANHVTQQQHDRWKGKRKKNKPIMRCKTQAIIVPIFFLEWIVQCYDHIWYFMPFNMYIQRWLDIIVTLVGGMCNTIMCTLLLLEHISHQLTKSSEYTNITYTFINIFSIHSFIYFSIRYIFSFFLYALCQSFSVDFFCISFFVCFLFHSKQVFCCHFFVIRLVILILKLKLKPPM